jgi:flagellar motor switch protein FliG
MTTPAIPGPRQAAVALVALGPERAAEIMRGLGEKQARALANEVAALGPVHPHEVRAILGELFQGLRTPGILPAPGKQMAKDLLLRALGPDVGQAMGDELDVPAPFAWLEEADPEAAGKALANEPPGAVAIALTHLEPRAALRVLTQLPPAERATVATRIAALGAVHPDTVRQVEATLRSRVSGLLGAGHALRVDGPDLLARLLARATPETSKELLAAVAANSPELADATRERLFTFDDLCALPARTLQVVLRAVDGKQLALALRNLPETTADLVLANLSERARESLVEEMELLTSARASEINEARAAIVAAARQLEDEGTVDLSRAEDE